ncbi:hypothetical protein [Amycolatopsis nigrescens]|uniref:hypothetical protein n=1 Tax=Amycolatopsis nigrescens TaxID=381445 RepID=UPI0003A0D099|nr:hypothetical protein [Amycolatopsis nigrescens]
MTTSSGATKLPPEQRREQALPRLHRPWRAMIAVVELVLAGLAVWAAFACWGNAVDDVVTRLSDGTELTSTRYEGDLIGAAIGLVTLALLLLVDAVRELLLAFYARHRRPRKEEEEGEFEDHPELYGAHASGHVAE